MIDLTLVMILCDNCRRGIIISGDTNLFVKEGWKAVRVDAEWRDFCCESCEREFKSSKSNLNINNKGKNDLS